jgi:tight adherence protein C
VNALEGWAVVCGVALGLGLWSMIAVVPRLSRPRLADRVAPWIVDVSEEARRMTARATVHPVPLVGTLIGPLFGGARRGLSRLFGGGETIAVRIRQAGLTTSVDAFRNRQLVWMAVGFGAGTVFAVSIGAVRPVPPIIQLATPVICAACGFAVKDWLLKRAAIARLRRIAAEFPTVVEFLTLSLSAGEGIVDAVRRVSRVSSGELAREFAVVVTAINSGVPVAAALTQAASGIRLPILTRCIDAITAALERGTPLAEVLRAQAADARTEAKRDLLESAGKKEVAMLVPLVFLILPTTILFAIYPGLFVLQSGF